MINDSIHKIKGNCLSDDYQKRFSVIKKVLKQKKQLFEGRKVTDAKPLSKT